MRRRTRRAIVGIEAAIVLIAFVIVAAALAFVALNMGLFTTQKSKEVIQRGLGEASSSLEVDGSATGYSPDGNNVSTVIIPVKLAPGRETVDMAKSKTTISLLLGTNGYENIHNGTFILTSISGTYYLVNASDTTIRYQVNDISGTAVTTPPDASIIALNLANLTDASNSTYLSTGDSPVAYVVFLRTVNDDTVLEFGEKAMIVVLTNPNDAATPYEKVSVEIRPPEGAPLTVERTIPATLPSSGGSVDLG